jgi:hypothetical protein
LVLDAAIGLLPERSKILCRTLVGNTVFVQRSHKQISRPRFYNKFYVRDFSEVQEVEWRDRIVDVSIDVGGAVEVAQVEFFRGRIDSIQLERPASYYTGKSIKVVNARLSESADSIAESIDRHEHNLDS